MNRAGLDILRATPEEYKFNSLERCEEILEYYVTGKLHENEKAALLCFIATLSESAFANSGIPELINTNNGADRIKAANLFKQWSYTSKGSIIKGMPRIRSRQKKLFLTFAVVRGRKNA